MCLPRAFSLASSEHCVPIALKVLSLLHEDDQRLCPMDKLTKILARLSHLNLEGDIVQKQPYASGLGFSCDVYSAWSTKLNKKVAVKQIRVFLKKDLTFAKVRSLIRTSRASIVADRH